VLVPIAVALIVKNGLSPTAVLLPAGLLYVLAAGVYRLPIPVQPLKAFGAIAIAQGLGSDEVAAGALLMGLIFLVLGLTRAVDRAARAFPRALIRGIQLTVGLLFLKIAWGLVADPPTSFESHALDPMWAVPLGAAVVAAAIAFRRRSVTLALVGVGIAVMIVNADGPVAVGPAPIEIPDLEAATFWTALTVLVLPQLPLSFANSCLATADAARTYFGPVAARVTPGRLASTLGSANLVAGALSGMPVCHGAGGLTAHVSFGARTWRAPVAVGVALLAVAVTIGSGLATLLVAFPLPILAGLLAVAGLLHITLLRDLVGRREWLVAVAVGLLGFQANLVVALGVGLAVWWGQELVRFRSRTGAGEPSRNLA
jgi:hypothetical protein